MPLRLALLALFALAGCGQEQRPMREERVENLSVIDVGEPPPAPEISGGRAEAAQQQIAYTYSHIYRLPTDRIVEVQAAHQALCAKLGAQRCRVVRSVTETNDDDGNGNVINSLELLVDARIANAFGGDLDRAATGAGGTSTSREVAAEDLSKAMIDTGARIRAKQALADRLLTLLKTKSGGVADLVPAERAYAEVAEELDAARTQMAEMQGRVAQSKVTITYQSREATSRGFARPLRDAADEAGQTLGSSIGALLTFIIAALPWIALLAALLWLKRRLGWRIRWPWRRAAPSDPSS